MASPRWGWLYIRSLAQTPLRLFEACGNFLRRINALCQKTLNWRSPTINPHSLSNPSQRSRKTALYGGLLAVVILFLFLRHFRSTIIVGLSIPVSIIATFNLMYFMDLSLNIMTLGGLALGAGMLVDNAVVVLENIFRHRQLGKNAMQAASEGSNEVTAAISASTLTTVVVFVPIVFLGGVTAQLFKEQALTVVFSLLTSLLVALIMIPALASRFVRGVPRSAGATYELFGWLLRWALNHRFFVILVTIIITVGSVPVAMSIKREFIPQAAERQFVIKMRMPPGTELEVTDRAVTAVEGWLNELGGNVEHIFSRMGKGAERVTGAEQEPEGPHTGRTSRYSQIRFRIGCACNYIHTG